MIVLLRIKKERFLMISKKAIGLLSVALVIPAFSNVNLSAIELDSDMGYYESVKNVLEVNQNLEDLENSLKPILKNFFDSKIEEYINFLGSNHEDIQENKNSLIECIDFYIKNFSLRERHFGYPANMCKRTALVNIFSSIEKEGFLANNCGDVNESGNYRMDSKEIERDILKLFAEKFGIQDNYWGYITSGGSESNEWGINASFKKNPDGILYFCESAHYSIYKNSETHKRRIIPQTSEEDESINCEALFKQIEKDYSQTKSPANIILTWGTTKYGSCDDVKRITDFLIEKHIPYYVHVDAALFGGIPNNQVDAPVISEIKNLNIDSISTSLHKYIGVPTVKSILLSTKKASGEHIDYIGQTDNTTSGSRDIMPFSTRQQVIDILNHSDPCDYKKNIEFFEKCLKDKSVNFVRNGKSNIFVVDAPSDEICKKYQLSCFTDKAGHQKSHIIIFPYQNQNIIKELAEELS